MALTIRLQSSGPGQGVFLISGISAGDKTLELAIQRNLDDKYLGEVQAWQATPHWHAPLDIDSSDEGLGIRVGPEIIDAVTAPSNMALRVFVRWDGQEDSGVLRIKGHMLGSPAALPADVLSGPEDPTPDPDPDFSLMAEPRQEAMSEPTPSPRPRSRAGLWVILLLALVCVAGVTAWQLGWLDPWFPPEPPMTEAQPALEGVPQEIQETAPGEATTTTEATTDLPAVSGESVETKVPTADGPPAKTVTGVDLVRAFLKGGPTPRAQYAEAEKQEQAGDCDAAMILYNRAAQADSAIALDLARRYDPRTHDAQSCIKAPDLSTATLLYEEAARAGDPSARRRLGQILVKLEASGPVFEDGIRWLQQAAQGGDEEARGLLKTLGH